MLLKIENLNCYFGKVSAVDDVSLTIDRGQTLCLVGSSGSGKTTLLRAIAGFHTPNSGFIAIGGKPVFSENIFIPTQDRKVGMVFQDHALFPHLSVSGNVGSGLWMLNKVDRRKTVSRYLDIMGISDLSDRYPHQLSAGQQQRVALARAIAPQPILLLMDEPFSNLDLDLRIKMGEEISEILRLHEITSVMVTHDQRDALILGDQVGVIINGQLLQIGTPYDVYHEPSCRDVADFIGDGVFIPGCIIDNSFIRTKFADFPLRKKFRGKKNSKVDLLIRPEDVIFDDKSEISGVVIKRAYKGAEITYTLSINSDVRVLATMSSHHYFQVGEKIPIFFKLDHLVFFEH